MSRAPAVALALLALAGAGLSGGGTAPAAPPLLADDFDRPLGPHRLITNAYAAYHPDDPRSVRSPRWEVTSGSLFSRRGRGWTGRPDLVSPGPRSALGTGSAVFRMRSRREDLRDVIVRVRVRVLHWTHTRPRQLPAVVLWVRYSSPQRLYWPSVLRADGRASIVKKVPGGPHPFNGGTYYQLPPFSARARRPVRLGRWYRIGVVVCDQADGAVTITTSRDGRVLQRAVDRGVGQRVRSTFTGRRVGNPSPALLGPGRVGIRADNAELELTSYEVRPAGRSCDGD